MKIEAKDLQSALTEAAKQLSCSVVDLEYSVLQHPSKGFLGFFQKNAIIQLHHKKKNFHEYKKNSKKKESYKEERNNTSFQDKKIKNSEFQAKQEEVKTVKTKNFKYEVKTEEIFENFHKENKENDSKLYLEEIKTGLEKLIEAGKFNIKIVELKFWDKENIYLKLDGEDAALLIGKEAYRYKALSYLLHNWINAKYKLFIKLEIADFLKNQEAGMDFYLKNIIDKVQNTGKGQTKYLDGVLIKIALEKLRKAFPNKYVGIKQNGDQKFVVVNDFFKKDE